MVTFARARALGAVLREAGEQDAQICRSIFAETRAGDLTAMGLNAEMVDQLIDMQFRAQDAQFTAAYPAMRRLVIVRDDQAVGRLYYNETEAAVRLVEIALLCEARGQGIGTAILHDLAGQSAPRCVDLHVARDNPARRLFERAGFVTRAEGPVYMRLERQPDVLQEGESRC